MHGGPGNLYILPPAALEHNVQIVVKNLYIILPPAALEHNVQVVVKNLYIILGGTAG